MSNSPSPFHMLRIELDPEQTLRHAHRRKLPTWTIDDGYLVHSLLREVFADSAPQPFAVQPFRNGRIQVLAYGDANADALRDHAERFADPSLFQAIHWSNLASKPMPSRWSTGEQYTFELRFCPVVRVARADAPIKKKGAEVDAYLARCWQEGAGSRLDREQVYRDWLVNWMSRRDAAQIQRLQVLSYQSVKLLRRTQGTSRKARHPQRPSVLMQGRLQVQDEAAFLQVLRQGVGRHRAFGFGMLLLKPR